MPHDSDAVLPSKHDTKPDAIVQIMQWYEASQHEQIRQFLDDKDDGAIAHILESLPPEIRQYMWGSIPNDDELKSDILEELDDGVRNSMLEQLPDEQIIDAARQMEPAELVDVLDAASDELTAAILQSLSTEERDQLNEVMNYPEGSAGRYLSREWVSVRADVTLEVVTRYLKRLDKLPIHTDGLMVIDRNGLYQGKLSISTLLTCSDQKLVSDVMDADADKVHVLASDTHFAELFEERETESLAVVDDHDRLLGRVTIEDALDFIREQADQQVMNMAGLDEDEDLFAPIIPSAKRRMFWLGINLVTAFLASWVIGQFAEALDKLVALAVLMPIVASMGGIAGSQTLTLTIRGLALDQINSANTRWLAIKEVTIAGLNGIIWAVVVGFIAWIWFRDPGISMVLGIAMVINNFAASIAGLAVPLWLNRIGIDPALSGSVVLTTVTDVVGFMSFLGLATLLLL